MSHSNIRKPSRDRRSLRATAKGGSPLAKMLLSPQKTMQAFEVTGTIDPTEYVAQRAIEQTKAKAID